MKMTKKLLAILLSLLFATSVFYSCSKETTPEVSADALEKNEYVSFIKTKGDADCALIHIGDHNIIIDTGEEKDGKKIVKYLNECGVGAIDYMIITHFDKDHCGGGAEILKNFQVKQVVRPQYVEEKEASTEFLEAVRNKGVTETVISDVTEYRFDTITLAFYPADKEYEEKSSNNSSLIIKLTYLYKTVLFTGDIEADRIEGILTGDTSYLDCDVLKVPYHGREIENEEAFINTVTPSISIVTGSGGKVKKNIESLGSSLGDVYYTKNGTVTLYFMYQKDFEVSQSK